MNPSFFILLIVSTCFLSPCAKAVLAFEVVPQDVDRIVVVGLDAQVQIQEQAQAPKLRVTGIDEGSDPGQYTLEKKGRVLFVKMQEYSDKKEWKEVLSKAPSKKKVIDFTGASVPLDIQLREGQIHVQKWSKEIKVALVKGKFTSFGGGASLGVQIQNGDISIQDQNSKVFVDVYKGQVQIKNLNGDLEGNVFSGSLNVEKTKGFMQISSAQATTKITQSSGVLQFDTVKGIVITQQFTGRVEGQTIEGNVNLGINSDSDVHMKSLSGRVTIQTPPGSGTLLNLATTEGEISVPNELRVQRTATEKTVKGRLKGGEHKGTVVVRTQEGHIIVK
ncbi:MAG: hypothetical protein IPM97_06275 [Bdellovibrionaceae bacterium]|nr:hypothetical protein [Pseudobdellovibrionaceae bacterium]